MNPMFVSSSSLVAYCGFSSRGFLVIYMIFMMLAGYQEPFVSPYVMREDDAGSLVKEGVLLKVMIIWNSFHFFP